MEKNAHPSIRVDVALAPLERGQTAPTAIRLVILEAESGVDFFVKDIMEFGVQEFTPDQMARYATSEARTLDGQELEDITFTDTGVVDFHRCRTVRGVLRKLFLWHRLEAIRLHNLPPESVAG